MDQKKSNSPKNTSRDLLVCGNGQGIHDKLLLKSKRASSLHTEKVPRSSVLDRLQCFLPQMALANETLRQQMENLPAGHFDIESVEEAEKVIEMDVALVELEGSDSSEEEESPRRRAQMKRLSVQKRLNYLATGREKPTLKC
ncbi:hypothetical protein PHYPO_G00086130 [Pangasianodon hypophthalmus]|uniref:Uncharacterized protein n=1 Tax=Pangasianodon hypophthalmus TaxID=310915 RepID=A0A5N5LGP6_PANHP|nr:hypothetical protein PHYPO_G00086130 [Pangasianodon hypophthalmus]